MGCLELPTARQLDKVPALHLFGNPALLKGPVLRLTKDSPELEV